MREKLGVLRPAVPAQKKGQEAQDHEDPVQALGIGDGHVVEGRSQQIGQGDAQQQGGDALYGAISDRTLPGGGSAADGGAAGKTRSSAGKRDTHGAQ